MDKKKFKTVAIVLFAMLCILLTLMWIDWGHQLQIGSLVVNDIFSAVVSIILGAFVTMALLYAQTMNEDSRNKGSVIFKEKLKTFKDFLETLGDFMKDGQLNKEEIRILILKHSLVNINLTPSNQKVFNKAFSNIKEDLFFDDENGVPNYKALGDLYSEIANIFRAELYGKKIAHWESLDFDNFSEISNRKISSPMLINNFDDFLKELTPGRDFFLTVNTKTEGRKNYKFKFKPDTQSHFHFAFDYIQSIMKEKGFDLQIRFGILTKHLYKTDLIGEPEIRFLYQGHILLEISITNANRVKLFLSKQKEVVKSYPLETLLQYQDDLKNTQPGSITHELCTHLESSITEISNQLVEKNN
jgi:hypothetical protein